jgi:CubicO group peptidase (beta-lactamase class C family)
MDVHGRVAPGFEPVREVFARHFHTHGEVGAALCVLRGEEVLVDLWGGVRDPDTGAPWTPDTLANVFSVTKGLVAATILALVDQGKLDPDAPIAEAWPDFGRAGKARITLRQVLHHTAGVVAVDRPLTLDDVLSWQPVEDALVEQAPLWEPGTRQGYHMVTWGVILRALVPRATGRSVGSWLRELLAEPLSADVFLGLPDAEHPRVATLLPPGRLAGPATLARGLVLGGLDGRFFRNVLLRPGSPGSRAAANPRALGGFHLANWALPPVRRAELPWGNAHASARGIARLYAPLASDGSVGDVRVLSPAAAARPRVAGSWSACDETLRKPMGFSHGFLKEEPGLFAPHPEWFGHPGTGGFLGMADPRVGISLGYVMNRLRPRVRPLPPRALSHAVYACLGAPVRGPLPGGPSCPPSRPTEVS